MISLPPKVARLAFAFLLAATAGKAQETDLEKVDEGFKKGNLMKLSGGLSLNGIYYTGNNPENNRLPFTYFVNGGVNARLFNLLDVPVNFSVTNVGGAFKYPTLPSRIALHPTYKWATAHLGNVAMTFSPYTLNGHLFDGGGVELQPGKWRISAMAGRLQRAQDYDSANRASPAAYRRTGWGAKVGYVTEKFRVAYNVFRAEDDAGSLEIKPPDSLGIRPAQNLVMSLEGGVQIIKGLTLTGEYANTALTTNSADKAAVPVEGTGSFQPLNPFFERKTSSEYHAALRTNLTWAFRKSIIGVGYERVDPGYRTLGAYYFNSDLQSYTLNYTQRALKDRMTIALSAGTQNDNLNNQKAATNRRGVGSVNVSFMPNDRLYLLASYSNFLTYINIRPQFLNINQLNPYQYIDTLNFSQVSQNALLNLNAVVLKSATHIHSVNFMGNFLHALDKNGDQQNTGGKSVFYNGAVSWSTQFVPRKIGVSLGLNASLNQVGIADFTTIGPIGTFSWRSGNDRFFTGLSVSYNRTSSGLVAPSSIFNSRLNAGYALTKKQRLSFSVLGQTRNSTQGNPSDLVTTLGYDLSF